MEFPVREAKNIKPNIFYANILNDLLTEILGRDLSRIRYSLNDFFSQNDKVTYLEEKYEVTTDRVEEIKSKLTGYTLTKMQSFWLPILNIKKITNQLNYFKDGTIEIKDIATTLNIAFDKLNKYSESINYISIHNVSNLENLNSLFKILNITIEDYNYKAEIKIDFRHHFTSQIEGIKQKAKPLFSSKLYHHLSTLDIPEKSKFQDMVDLYLFEPIYKFDNYVLFIDVEATFIKAFKNKYPFLTSANFDLNEQVNNDYLNLYKKNEIKLKDNIANLKNHNILLEDFLSANINRSLLYFEDTETKLIELFNAYYKNSNIQNSENSQDNIDLSQYQNTNALEITKGETTNVDTISTPKGNHNPNGNRTDGGKQNPKANLIGMVAEKTVYDYLLIRNSSTEWISKNAARAGVNPEGSDSNGCDITYVDEANQIQYIEVKGKIDNQNHFYISYPEYCKAIEKKENYRIILVKNALDNEKREIIDIGNIFLLDDDSDVFNNKRFSANFNSLEIIFE